MNSLKLISFLLSFLSSFFLIQSAWAQYNTITDVTFTDVDGQTHNLYNLVGEGYRVILDFGFIGCGPCSDWSQHVGPELWQEYGPDGDNTLRIFYFEVGQIHSDSQVEDYYTGLGVEYPIINLDFFGGVIDSQYQTFFDANILDGGYPVHIYVCQDTTYRLDIGFGDPESYYIAEHILDNSCNGQDVHQKDVALAGLARPFSYCSQSNSPIEFKPELKVHHNGGIAYNLDQTGLPPQSEYSINDEFLVKTYINNTFFRTDTLNPNDWGDSINIGGGPDDIGQGINWTFFLPILEVQPNDSVKFELLYPEDSYMLNNTYSFKVEQEETKTASSNQFRLVLENNYMFVYLYAEGEVGGEPSQEINIQNGFDTLITINNGQCYAMSVVGVQAGNASLIQFNNNDTIFHRPIGGSLYESQLYYFNVDSTMSTVEEHHINTKLSHVQYYDLMGRSLHNSKHSVLHNGIYLKISYYSDGTFTSEKIVKMKNSSDF